MDDMIICVCRRLNEKAVRDAIESGARSPESVQSHHGCSFNCGKCRSSIGEMISAEVDRLPAQGELVAAE